MEFHDRSNGSNPFTQFYGQFLHQGNMLADFVRTSTYQKAFLNNSIDFKDKVVLDVGTGTGILAFFAIQAGASKVYAVDASNAVDIAKDLAYANSFSDKIQIIKGKIEEISLPEKVDIIISEPIGFLLVHERMLESYVIARDRFLKIDGLMMPTTGSIVFAPFSDDAVYKEQLTKLEFWNNSDFYGINMTSVYGKASQEYFSQPLIGYISPSCLVSQHRTIHTIDFNEVTAEELQNFEISFSFQIDQTSIVHGFACWFDIDFLGSAETVTLSTSPYSAGTHWYQCRVLLKDPVAVNKGQFITGSLKFIANEFFSYYIDIFVQLEGTTIISENRINLKDQQYSYLQTSS